MGRRITPEGLELIRQHEQLRLKAYRDTVGAGQPWTIGWGHTGPDVREGQTITRQQADGLLAADLAWAEKAVADLFPPLGPQQFSALVSWVFNVGRGAAEASTLRRRLQAGEPVQTVLSQELPRWVKGIHGKPLDGLVKRRAAEVALAAQDGLAAPQKPSQAPEAGATAPGDPQGQQGPDPVELLDFFLFFDGEPHQREAVELLAQGLAATPEGRRLLAPDAAWVRRFREKAPAKPAAKPAGQSVQLDVAYLYQLDSRTPEGARMCFSSSCAMLLDALRPGAITGAQEDDTYLARVKRYGDTTSAAAQIQALESYGLRARFRQDGTPADLHRLLAAGVPIPIGIEHKGPASKTHGSGHWIVVIGYDAARKAWICHDPFGELDNVNGGYVSTAPNAGRAVRYSAANLDKRWRPRGTAGWLVEAQP